VLFNTKVTIFSIIMTRTSYISIRWWRYQLGYQTGLVGFNSTSSLKQYSASTHLAPDNPDSKPNSIYY